MSEQTRHWPLSAHRRLAAVALAMAVAFGAARPALAQPSQATSRAERSARSFEQLEMLLEEGDRVTIVDTDGGVAKVKIVQVTPSSLRVSVDGVTKSIAERDVVSISHRRADSLGNGARRGAILGAALAVIPMVTLCARNLCGPAIGFGVFYTAMWTGVGVGFDALSVKDHIVYGRPSISSSVRVSPVLSPSQKGVRFSLSF